MKSYLVLTALILLPFIVGLPKNKNLRSESRSRSPISELLESEGDTKIVLKRLRPDTVVESGTDGLTWKPAKKRGPFGIPVVDRHPPLYEPTEVTELPPRRTRPLPYDPRRTWQTFLRHSERTERTEARNKKKAKQRVRSGGRYLPGPQGPPGPPGPRGPRGPSGANVTKEEILQNFKDLVIGSTERRTQIILDTKCESNCTSNAVNQTSLLLPPLIDIDTTAIIPRIPFAFIWRLSSDARIPRKSFVELKKLNQPFMGGAFQRGETESAEEGRFKITKKGFYAFYVTLHILNRSISGKKSIGPGDIVTGLLCIDSMCQKNISLESTALLVQGRKFTISFNGILFLEEGQYVSVFIDNNSKFVLKVLAGSQFSGFLAGI